MRTEVILQSMYGRHGDYDAYEDDAEDRYEEEEEYEEQDYVQEEKEPAPELSEFLKLRQQLKESFRNKLKQENSSSKGHLEGKRKTSSSDNYGSFFGPSQPVIAQRVIDERHSIIETNHIVSKALTSHSAYNRTKNSSSVLGESKNKIPSQPKPLNDIEKKVQTLKDMRDYSFLFSDDAEFPAPASVSTSRNPISPKFGTNPSANKPTRPISRGQEDRGTTSGSGLMHNSHAARIELSSNPRPREVLPQKIANCPERPIGSKSLPIKTLHLENKKASVKGSISSASISQKAFSSKPPITVGRQHSDLKKDHRILDDRAQRPIKDHRILDDRAQRPRKDHRILDDRTQRPRKDHPFFDNRRQQEQRRDILAVKTQEQKKGQRILAEREQQERKKDHHTVEEKLRQKRPLSTSKAPVKPQMKAPKQMPSYHINVDRVKKRPPKNFDDEDDGEEAIRMIRKMFGYNPERFNGIDEDDSDMEANFNDIQIEERRSSKIAKEEDERELRLIEEEERRERMRKLKKRK